MNKNPAEFDYLGMCGICGEEAFRGPGCRCERARSLTLINRSSNPPATPADPFMRSILAICLLAGGFGLLSRITLLSAPPSVWATAALSAAALLYAGCRIVLTQYGVCPCCHTPASGIPPAFNCRACGSRIFVRGWRFVPAGVKTE